MTKSTRSHPHFPTAAGWLLAISAVQYLVWEKITAAAWTNPAYSYSRNFISDLGNPIPNGEYNGFPVNSPFHPLMNLAFVTQGILFGAAALLLWRMFSGRVGHLLLTLAMIHSVGIIFVGVFHENPTIPMVVRIPHFIGAWSAIFGGNLIAILVGCFGAQVLAARWYRVASVLLGVAGIGAFVWLMIDRDIYAQAGGIPERISVYTILIWEAITGISILVANAKRARVTQPTMLTPVG